MSISSTQNSRIKAIRALRMRKHRTRTGHYLIEGIRIVEEALVRGAPVEVLLYAPDLLVSERGQALIEQYSHLERIAVTAEVFGSLSDRETPQGIAAVVGFSALSLDDVPATEDLFAIVAWQLSTPGNLGAIIRTADAAGASAVIIVEPSVDLYDPLTVRATMGSLYALPIIVVRDQDELPAWFAHVRASGVPLSVIGTSARACRLFYELNLSGPVALLIGNEQDGLSAYARENADVLARLPMAGSASSLNVSAATAAMAYEVVRQRLQKTT